MPQFLFFVRIIHAFNSWVTPTAKLLNRQGNPVVAQVDNELSITTQNNDYATILMADGASRVDIGPKPGSHYWIARSGFNRE